MSTADHELLKLVTDCYLKSRDFNGYYLGGDIDTVVLGRAKQLVRDGIIQVVDEQDYMNPHIRPWPSRRTIEEQVESLDALPGAKFGLCLYPTPQALSGVRVPKRLKDQPFSIAMAKGRGTLEPAYFSFDVLEQYRNDPRYHFSFGDFGVTMSISDEAYLDENELERDKVSLSHIGFAYDLGKYDANDPNSPIIRRVAAFYGDLRELTPEHQQRWKTYQVDDDGLRPHPAWWISQMGQWPDGVGPFSKLFIELGNINELWSRAFGEALFTHTTRPDDFGWILRASQREWDEFVLQLNKLVADNIRPRALDAASASKTNPEGKPLGPLSRLAQFMLDRKIPQEVVNDVLRPFNLIRESRQKPAHAIRANVTDQTYVHRQVSLLGDVNNSLTNIRRWLISHPKNQGWKPKHDTDEGYRM